MSEFISRAFLRSLISHEYLVLLRDYLVLGTRIFNKCLALAVLSFHFFGPGAVLRFQFLGPHLTTRYQDRSAMVHGSLVKIFEFLFYQTLELYQYWNVINRRQNLPMPLESYPNLVRL